MRKITMFGGAAAVTIVTVGALTIGTAAGTPVRTLRLYEHDTHQAQLDLGDKGDSPGDRFIYSGDLFDRKGGKNIGRAGGNCETVSTGAAHAESVCTVNLILAGGELTGQGMANTAELFGGKTVPFAITGGTGVYRNARGTGTVTVPTDVPNLADANFVLHLN
ncbi:MAG TPA: hypothetical protein VGF00_03865 [Acidimicrobiia bacterium]